MATPETRSPGAVTVETGGERGPGVPLFSGLERRGPERPGSGVVHWVAILLIAVGLLLRLVQYLANRSLWMDEGFLAMNLIERGFVELTGPLGFSQVAPVGYLWLSRLAVVLFGPSEYALRLVPLLAGCASVWFFWVLARRCLPEGAALLALAVFSTSSILIYYSSEVKQYSSDVAIAIGLLLGAWQLLERGVTRRRVVLFGLGGAGAVWLSHPAMLLLAGIGVVLVAVYVWRREYAALPLLGVCLGLWAAGVIPAALLATTQTSPDTAAFMKSFWANSFMPFPPERLYDLRWFERTARGLFLGPLGFALPGLAMMACAVGCAWTAARRPALLMLLLAPVVVTLFASGLQLYPFGVARTYRPFSAGEGRTLLFLVPGFLLLCAAGAAWVARLPRRRHRALARALAAGALLYPVPAALAALPYHRVDLRPPLLYLLEHRQPDDGIYVYHGAYGSFQYYAYRYGISADAYWMGHRNRRQPEAYLRELEQLRDRRRLWVVFSEVRRSVVGNEGEFILSHLDSIGVRLAEMADVRAGVFLYELTPGPSLVESRQVVTPR